MGIPEGAAIEPPTVPLVAHWGLLIFGEQEGCRLSNKCSPAGWANRHDDPIETLMMSASKPVQQNAAAQGA